MTLIAPPERISVAAMYCTYIQPGPAMAASVGWVSAVGLTYVKEKRQPTEAASLHRFKSNDANWAFPNLHRTTLGEHPCRLFCLIIVRARQGMPIENVPFGREDEHLVLFRGYLIRSAAKPPTNR
jgi:hypothetical protein